MLVLAFPKYQKGTVCHSNEQSEKCHRFSKHARHPGHARFAAPAPVRQRGGALSRAQQALSRASGVRRGSASLPACTPAGGCASGHRCLPGKQGYVGIEGELPDGMRALGPANRRGSLTACEFPSKLPTSKELRGTWPDALQGEGRGRETGLGLNCCRVGTDRGSG